MTLGQIFFWEGAMWPNGSIAFGRKRVSSGLLRTEHTDQTRGKGVRKPSSQGVWLPAKRLWVRMPISAKGQSLDYLCASWSRTLNQSCSLWTWITNKSGRKIPMQMHIPNATSSHIIVYIFKCGLWKYDWVWLPVRDGVRGVDDNLAKVRSPNMSPPRGV